MKVEFPYGIEWNTCDFTVILCYKMVCLVFVSFLEIRNHGS